MMFVAVDMTVVLERLSNLSSELSCVELSHSLMNNSVLWQTRRVVDLEEEQQSQSSCAPKQSSATKITPCGLGELTTTRIVSLTRPIVGRRTVTSNRAGVNDMGLLHNPNCWFHTLNVVCVVLLTCCLVSSSSAIKRIIGEGGVRFEECS